MRKFIVKNNVYEKNGNIVFSYKYYYNNYTNKKEKIMSNLKEIENMVVNGQLEKLKEKLSHNDNIDYPRLFSTQMTYNDRSFNTLLESVPNIWKNVIINDFGEEKTIPLALNIARHIRRIDPHGLWDNYLKKIEKDITSYTKEEQINLFTRLIIEVDDYPVHHYNLDKVLNNILGNDIKAEMYFDNMNSLTFGFDSIVDVAICNATTERRNNLLVDKVKQKDFSSVKTILDTTRVQPSDLRSIKVDNLSLHDYINKELVEYKEQLVKDQPIKDIDKLFDNEIKNRRIGKNLHVQLMNYHALEKVVTSINEQINQTDRKLYSKKM